MGHFSLTTNLALGDLKYPCTKEMAGHAIGTGELQAAWAENTLTATNEAAESSKFCPIPLLRSAQSDDQYANRAIYIKVVAIERLTQSQGSRELWCEMRNVTLTLSRFHHVLHHEGITPEFVENLFAERKLLQVVVVHCGRVHESGAMADYLTSKSLTGNAGVGITGDQMSSFSVHHVVSNTS